MTMNSRIALFAAMLAIAVGCSQPGEPAQFDADHAWEQLLLQCEFGPRVPGTAARDSVATHIARKLQGYGARLSFQQFEVDDPYGDGQLRLINVIASFEPKRTRRVMLCAHFDTRPWSDQEDDDSLKTVPVLGANDGASGVAVLIEMGRLISLVSPPDIGVDLVFFDGEDYGKQGDLSNYLLGSKHFAANLAGYRPECAILLDMVAGIGTVIGKESYSLQNSAPLCNDLFERAQRLNLDFFIPEPALAVYDDHIPLIQAGIPAVDLIATAYEHWHTTRDTPDKCSKDLMAQVGALLSDFLYHYSF